MPGSITHPLFNRASGGPKVGGFKVPDDGWHEIVRPGEYPHPKVGIQVIDDKAIESMVASFNRQASTPDFPGLQVDYDHLSYRDESLSEAAGWIEKLENRSGSLWAQVHWTPEGKAAVEGGRYRLISAVFDPIEPIANNRIRPTGLDSIALTNKPNIRNQKPVSNRSTDTDSMKAIAQKLGLAPEATETDILAGIDKVMNRATSAEAGLVAERATTAALNTQIQKIEHDEIETLVGPILNRAKPEEVEAVRKLLKADREGGKSVLNRLVSALDGDKGPGPQGTPGKVYNRAATKNPGQGGQDDGASREPSAAEKARHEKIFNRAKEIAATQNVSWARAYRSAEVEIPPVA